MKTHLLLLSGFCSVLSAFSQKSADPDKMKTFNIVVNYDTYTVKTQMLKDTKKVKVMDDRTYMWCSANKIIETKAGYDGKLLHGYYKSFYFENNQLRESGMVKYGLKNKEWRFWYADGRLKEIITYKNGKKNGTYKLFNDAGNLMAKGHFKNDLLHGHFYTYTATGAVLEKKKYKNGVEVIAAPKAAKLKKEPAAAESKKEKKEKAKKEPATKKEKEKVAAPQKQEGTTDKPATEKRSFGQKIRDLFKKKPKTTTSPENKPASSCVMLFKLKLRGGALYIALIISIVIGIVLSVFILIAYFNQRQVLGRLALTQLQFNLKSGLSMAGSAAFSNTYNNTWQALTFNEDSIRIKKLQWGSYELICVETKNRRHYLKEAALYGMAASADTAMVIADRSRPVGLSGKIIFNGGCYFPKAGIKPAYIEGESFISDGSLNAFIREAPMQVPPVKTTLPINLAACMQGLNPATDSLLAGLPEQLNVNFSCRTAVLQSGNLTLSGHSLRGNIKLVAEEVVINEGCQLSDILIVATKVRIKKGFKGSLHILAKDSIIAEDSCMLDYPSSLTVYNQELKNTSMKGIFLGRKCVVHGALMALSETADNPIIVKLNKDCEIYGLVYSGNFAHVQGKIFGTVFCQTLLLTTPSAVYENHLLSCELDPKKFGGSLVVPSVFKENYSYKCCKWL